MAEDSEELKEFKRHVVEFTLGYREGCTSGKKQFLDEMGLSTTLMRPFRGKLVIPFTVEDPESLQDRLDDLGYGLDDNEEALAEQITNVLNDGEQLPEGITLDSLRAETMDIADATAPHGWLTRFLWTQQTDQEQFHYRGIVDTNDPGLRAALGSARLDRGQVVRALPLLSQGVTGISTAMYACGRLASHTPPQSGVLVESYGALDGLGNSVMYRLCGNCQRSATWQDRIARLRRVREAHD